MLLKMTAGLRSELRWTGAGFRQVEAPGQPSVVELWWPTLEYPKIKGDKTICGGPWAAFSNGAVEAHPTLEYPKK